MLNWNSSFGSSAAAKVTSFLSNIKTSFETTIIKKRNAVIRKRPIKIHCHVFTAVLLTEPTFCSQCNDFILGLVGFSCKQCQLVSHQKCLTAIQSTCVKSALDSTTDNHDQKLVRPNPDQHHHFEPHIFSPLDPTACKHCGTLIYSLTKLRQGLICSICKTSVHYDCKELVCTECTPGNQNSNNNDPSTKYNASSQSAYEHQSKISIENFEILKLLGTGSFSKVYLARFCDKQFAIKVIKKTNLEISSDPGSVFTEMNSLKLGRLYPFLAIAHCCFQSKDRLYIVMEHVVGRDLVYHIKKARKFTLERARFHAAEIVLALIYLHNCGIVYRDLKLDNVILDKNGHCKLIDFGMSKKISVLENNKTRTFCGTPNYISPEIIRELDYDYSIDWWSLGVLIYEMLVGYSPFDAHDEDEIYRLIVNEQVDIPSTLSYEARSLLEGLLTKDPRDRLGCQIMNDGPLAIKEHPFFLFPDVNGNNQAFQWDAIEAMRMEPPYKPTEQDLTVEGENNDDDINLTPINPRQLERTTQTDFDGFSFYSGSFKSLANFD